MWAGSPMPKPPGAEEDKTRTPHLTRIRVIRGIRGPMPGLFWMSDGSPSDLPLWPSRLCGSEPSRCTTETRRTQRRPRREGRGRPRCRGQNGRLTGGNRPSRSQPNLLFTNASDQIRIVSAERVRRSPSPSPPSRSLLPRPITPSPQPHSAHPTGREAETNVKCRGLNPSFPAARSCLAQPGSKE